MAEEPLLISQLVRFACDSIAMRALWHGLADHRWDDAQLAKFQDLLDRRDYAGGMLRALEGERALGNEAAEYLLRRRGRGLAELDKMGSGNPSDNSALSPLIWLVNIVPSGWYRQNQIGFLTGWQEILEHSRIAMNRTNRAVTLLRDSHIDRVTDDIVMRVKANPSPFKILVGMLLPGISKATGKADRAQATAGMAVVACALERHRLAHGSFPASLAELVPAYLPAVPADWMGGQPLHYQRTDDGWFRLWSIGPNGKDDGGVFRAIRDDGRGVGDDLDWVWPLPLPTREPRLF